MEKYGIKYLYPGHYFGKTSGDDEVLLETRINGKIVRVKFNLRKIFYKGHLEGQGGYSISRTRSAKRPSSP